MDYRKIMLTYATPERDTQALHMALEMAYRHEADLTVLHVHGECDKQSCQCRYLYTADELQQQLDKANGYGVPITVEVAEGKSLVSATLGQAADYDLVVVADAHAACFAGCPEVADKVLYPAQAAVLPQAV